MTSSKIKSTSYVPNCTVFMLGDLVQLYGVDVTGETGPLYTGIYIGWDTEDDGWIIKTEGKIQVFPTVFWNCRRVATL